MKKNLMKTVTVSTFVLVLAATPVFAKGNDRVNKTDNRREPPKMERPASPSSEKPMPTKGVRNGKFDMLGTVSAIDKNAQTITIKDADGKEIKVHVNPFTHLATEKDNKPAEITLDDIKAGDWVAVSKFGTETTVLEAKQIFVKQS